ncbi:MAG: glucosaminidase domain-containing protein [Saprospiraceae bacterium]|nr:glucosaminidase domain-containing protein [Saprospiraceae bacterium]
MKQILPFFVLLSLTFFLSECKTLSTRKTSSTTMPRGRAADMTAMSGPVGGDINLSYVNQYSEAAMSEMRRTGIPASITLAQGILESGAGQSQLAREANNHFGIKCGNDWTGASYRKKDDDKDSNGNLIESCFRKYRDPRESYHDHSEFLRDPRKANRYGFLFNLPPNDYQGWAKGLQSAGYATSGTYASKLINLIERYQLYVYDDPNTAPAPVKPSNPDTAVKPSEPGAQPGASPSAGGGIDLPPMERVRTINDTKMVTAQSGETLQDIARMYSLPVVRVQSYNDNGYAMSQKLPAGSTVYIQRKHDRYRGSTGSHFMKKDQTMFEVSQIYGVQLPALLKRNNLVYGEEPATGEKILLRGKRDPNDKPRLREKTTASSTPSTPATPGADSGINRPSNGTPGTPTPKPVSDNSSMTPDANEELFEIGGEEPKPAPPPVKPVQPAQPTVTPPSTSGTPYPGEPNKPPTTTQPGAGQPKYYTVEKGETLFRVSQKFNTTVAKLKELNNLKSDYIQAGQRLRVN